MKTKLGLICLLWLFALPAGAASGSGMPGWFKESFLDIGEDVREATSANKRVLLFFYQEGCPYCAKLLADNFGDAGISAQTQAQFDVIAINIWGDREITDAQGEVSSEKQVAARLGVQYTPTLLFLNEEGQAVARIDGYFPPHRFKLALDYVANHQEGKMKLAEYLANNEAAPAAGSLYQSSAFLTAPIDLAANRKEANKPLLVFFEQKSCPSCDELHAEISKRAGLAATLSNFDLVMLDLRSDAALTTPDGDKLSVKGWARQLSVQYAPSLVFFDQGGKEVFRIDAWLKAFHLQTALEYVLSGAYRYQPEFQRFIHHRTQVVRELGATPELMD